jgi:hypothetical protein
MLEDYMVGVCVKVCGVEIVCIGALYGVGVYRDHLALTFGPLSRFE